MKKSILKWFKVSQYLPSNRFKKDGPCTWCQISYIHHSYWNKNLDLIESDKCYENLFFYIKYCIYCVYPGGFDLSQ